MYGVQSPWKDDGGTVEVVGLVGSTTEFYEGPQKHHESPLEAHGITIGAYWKHDRTVDTMGFP